MNNTNIKTILKHPYIGTSPNLIESFLIVGYDTNDILLSINKNVIESKRESTFCNNSDITKKKNQSQTRLIEEIYPTDSKVSIVSEICSNNSKSITPYDIIIKKCFPYKSDTIYLNLQKHNYPFSFHFFISDKMNNNNFGFVYKFYESFKLQDNSFINIPKAFCIISHYPYFHFFKCVAIEIYKGFTQTQFIAPLEIVLYNIINFIPSSTKYFLNNFYLETFNEMYIEKLYPYPTFDIELQLLLKDIGNSNFVELFLYMFFEIDLIFFSTDIEKLSLLLHIMAMLVFP